MCTGEVSIVCISAHFAQALTVIAPRSLGFLASFESWCKMKVSGGFPLTTSTLKNESPSAACLMNVSSFPIMGDQVVLQVKCVCRTLSHTTNQVLFMNETALVNSYFVSRCQNVANYLQMVTADGQFWYFTSFLEPLTFYFSLILN